MFENTQNIATNAAGLTIWSVSAAAVKIANTTHFTLNGTMFYVTGQEISLSQDYLGNSLVIANDMQCILTIITDVLGNVSFEQGAQVDHGTHYDTGSISHNTLQTHAILWYVFIKNEIVWGASFTWWTTALSAAGVTTAYTDSFSTIGM